jgi:hypothetical protein
MHPDDPKAARRGPALGEARARSYGGQRAWPDRTLGPEPGSRRASLAA